MKNLKYIFLGIIVIALLGIQQYSLEKKYQKEAEAFKIDDKTYTVQDDGKTVTEDLNFTETKTVTENVGTYNECIQKLTTWQNRVTKQQALCDGMESDNNKLAPRQ